MDLRKRAFIACLCSLRLGVSNVFSLRREGDQEEMSGIGFG